MQSAKKPTTTDQYVGRKIKEVRKHSKLTMIDLADQLGISYQQVQKYESGRNRVSAGVIFDIARMFKLPIGFFFPVHEYQPQYTPSPIDALAIHQRTKKVTSSIETTKTHT